MSNEFSTYCSKMTNDLFEILEVEFEETSEAERQIIAAFSFGMINGYAMDMKMDPATVHGTLIGILINEFKYSENQASDFAQMLINSTNREYHPTMYTIIHRGIEAYYDYKENKENEVYDNLTFIIDMIVNNNDYE